MGNELRSTSNGRAKQPQDVLKRNSMYDVIQVRSPTVGTMAHRATVRSRTGFGNLGDRIWAPETTTPPTHLTCNSLPYAAADKVRIASSTTMNSVLGAVQMVRYVSKKASHISPCQMRVLRDPGPRRLSGGITGNANCDVAVKKHVPSRLAAMASIAPRSTTSGTKSRSAHES